MNIRKRLCLFLEGAKLRKARLSSNNFVHYLREKGLQIGANTHIDPHAEIDISRPSLVTVGSNCYLNHGFTLLTHDWVTGVLRNVYGVFYNSSGHVTIGNNVGTGYNVTILKGVTIGDNVFIAANSLVNRDIPSNTIVGGCPARPICTLDEFLKKREAKCEDEAFEYIRSIVDRFHRRPLIEEMREEFIYFVDKDNYKDYKTALPIDKQLGGAYARWLDTHKRKYTDFETFIRVALTGNYKKLS